MPPLYRQTVESGTSFTNLSPLLIFTRRKTKPVAQKPRFHRRNIMQKFDYRDQSSIPEKMRLIQEMFGAIPKFLIYNIQDSWPSRQDTAMIKGALLPPESDIRGRIFTLVFDPTRSRPPVYLRSFNILCVVDPNTILYEFTLEDGQVCHLLQAGSKKEGDGCVNFMDLWGPSPQDPVREVDLSNLNVETSKPEGPSPSEPPHKSWFARMIAWILGTG